MSEKVLKTEAYVDRLPEVLAFIDGFLEEQGVSPKVQMQIDISIEELFVNIANYAYPAGGGWVEIHASVKDTVAEFVLIDGGIPYDPLAKADPDVTLNADERQIGGLGIYMVKKHVDNMYYEYRDEHNILKISKKLS
ncbi:MAG: ATP-binding protein [Lachnospiraceae bacterium]|nr:ATP-binding protein [Lachnospiraceae bacterium]